jgi:hypothetical protein
MCAATPAAEDRSGSLASAAALRPAAAALPLSKSAQKHAHKGVLPRSARSQ